MMATLIDAPEFTANEVYEIQATDNVEGAASGASFGGIGLSNQPHQQLANRTAFLKQRQDVNISNIAALLAFTSGFTGTMGASGYLRIPFTDTVRGALEAIVQWGAVTPPGALGNDTEYTVTWPIAFPNTCVWAGATLINFAADEHVGKLVIEVVGFSATSGSFFSDLIGGAALTQVPNDGFYWIAIGF
jgi:hypothetical protein